MDAIDRKILALLQQDASHSVAEIGNLATQLMRLMVEAAPPKEIR